MEAGPSTGTGAWIEGKGPGRKEGRSKGCALGLRVWRLGQLSWEVNHSPVLLTGVGCAWAYGVCTNVEKGWLLASGGKGKRQWMIMWEGLGCRVNLG